MKRRVLPLPPPAPFPVKTPRIAAFDDSPALGRAGALVEAVVEAHYFVMMVGRVICGLVECEGSGARVDG